MFQYGRAVEEGPKMEWNMAQFSFRFHHEIFEEFSFFDYHFKWFPERDVRLILSGFRGGLAATGADVIFHHFDLTLNTFLVSFSWFLCLSLSLSLSLFV